MQIQKPPGGGNEHVYAPFQKFYLFLLGNTAHHHAAAVRQIFSVSLKRFLYLQCQFARGRENERADTVLRFPV